MKNISMILVLLYLSGCSGDDGTTSEEHVWKGQTDTLDKARAVEDVLSQDAMDKSRMIEDSDN